MEKADIVRALNSLTYLVVNSKVEVAIADVIEVRRQVSDGGTSRMKESFSAEATVRRKIHDTSRVAEFALGDQIVKSGAQDVREASNEACKSEKELTSEIKDNACTSSFGLSKRPLDLADSTECKRTKMDCEISVPGNSFDRDVDVDLPPSVSTSFSQRLESISPYISYISHALAKNSNVSCYYKAKHSVPFDVSLETESDECLPAHRCVLRGLSEVFAAMLSHGFKEGSQSEIPLKDISHSVILFMVHYAYGCGCKIPSSCNEDNVCLYCLYFLNLLPVHGDSGGVLGFDLLLELLQCADRFLIQPLKDQCELLLMKSLTSARYVDAYSAAVLYNAPRLRAHALRCVFTNDNDMNCVYRSVMRLLDAQLKDSVLKDLECFALDRVDNIDRV